MTIRINKKDIRSCFGIVSNVCQAYYLRALVSHQTIKSWDVLCEIAPDIAGKPIEFLELQENHKNHHVKGYFVAKNDCYQVVALSGLNFCWGRFIRHKELFHVFLDTDEYHSTDIDATVSQIYAALDENDPVGPDPALSSEKVAELAAMEFLFPYKDRLKVLSSGRPSKLVAEQYKIPLIMVEKYLTSTNIALLEQYCA